MINVIFNADDFGLSTGVNRGIVRAHEEGIVTGGRHRDITMRTVSKHSCGSTTALRQKAFAPNRGSTSIDRRGWIAGHCERAYDRPAGPVQVGAAQVRRASIGASYVADFALTV